MGQVWREKLYLSFSILNRELLMYIIFLENITLITFSLVGPGPYNNVAAYKESTSTKT